jgi:hypothetical protein
MVTETQEQPNPIIQEAETLNETGSDIVAEIVKLDKAEAETVVPVVASAATVAETVVPETSAPTTPPVLPVQTPSELSILQRQLADAQRKIQEHDEQAQTQRITDEVATYRQQLQQQLEAQGLGPEQAALQAKTFADQAHGFYVREMQLRQQSQAQTREIEAKWEVAVQIGQEHGIHPRELIQYNSPQAMIAAAQQQKRIKGLEEQVKKLTQNTVPSQTLESGQGAIGGRGEGAWLQAYNNGDRSPQAQAAAKKAAGL